MRDTSDKNPIFIPQFPSISCQSDTPFSVYQKKGDFLVEGFTDRIAFKGTTSSSDSDLSYYLGLEDDEGNLELVPTKKVYFERSIRALDEADKAIQTGPAGQYIAAKKSLGASFGTRKAQNVMKNRNSNIIDTTNLIGVSNILVDNIMEDSKNVPTAENVQSRQDQLRPVPKYHIEAESPDCVYLLEDVISPEEMEAIYVKPFLKAGDENTRLSLLPSKSCSYLNVRLSRVLAAERPESRRIKIIYYASLLVTLVQNLRLLRNKDKLAEKLNHPPSIILDSILSKFTSKGSIDKQNMERLLAWIFVLALHLDNFSVDVKVLQDDLSLPSARVNTLFKELGCTVSDISETQRVALGLNAKEAKGRKRAVLKVPLQFPAPKRGPNRK